MVAMKRWLDKAAIVTEEEAKDSNAPPNLWNLVTVHRVEELKAIIRMHPIWASGILLIMSSSHLGSGFSPTHKYIMEGGISTYLGAAPIVHCLEKYQPNVIITSRIADAALFLAPMTSTAEHAKYLRPQNYSGTKPSPISVPDKLLQLVPKDCGWKGWGEISYGGYKCVERAKAAEYLINRKHAGELVDETQVNIALNFYYEIVESTNKYDPIHCRNND